MKAQKNKTAEFVCPDELVPDPMVCIEFNITPMTLWRWDHDAELAFPPPSKIRKRNFRSRRAIDDFKKRVLQNSLRRDRSKKPGFQS